MVKHPNRRLDADPSQRRSASLFRADQSECYLAHAPLWGIQKKLAVPCENALSDSRWGIGGAKSDSFDRGAARQVRLIQRLYSPNQFARRFLAIAKEHACVVAEKQRVLDP